MKYILLISIILQFIAAFWAIKLTKVTKYAASWILFSFSFLFIAIKGIFDLLPYLNKDLPTYIAQLNIWINLIVAFSVTIGVFLIRQIFVFMKKVEHARIESDKKILIAVIQTEERERKRFAKDLHDGLGPLLSTVKMSISALNQLEGTENSVKKDIILNADIVINEAIVSIKEISNHLSPNILNDFGLASAIRTFSSKINTTKALNISFNSNMFEVRLGENVEVILYRVACELINNTIKHAKAKNIDIELNKYDQVITLVYADDGIGFDVPKILNEQGGGMGYSNILNRLKSIKGTINVESNRENGTNVILKVII